MRRRIQLAQKDAVRVMRMIRDVRERCSHGIVGRCGECIDLSRLEARIQRIFGVQR